MRETETASLGINFLAGLVFGLTQLVKIPNFVSAFPLISQAAPVQTVSTGAVPSSNQVILSDAKDKYPLGLYLDILEDRQKQWTIQDVASAPLSQKFVRSQVEQPSFGFTTSVYWVRLQLHNPISTNTKLRTE